MLQFFYLFHLVTMLLSEYLIQFLYMKRFDDMFHFRRPLLIIALDSIRSPLLFHQMFQSHSVLLLYMLFHFVIMAQFYHLDSIWSSVILQHLVHSYQALQIRELIFMNTLEPIFSIIGFWWRFLILNFTGRNLILYCNCKTCCND